MIAPLVAEPERLVWVWFAGRHIPEPARHYWHGSDQQKQWLAEGRYFATRADAQEVMNNSNFGGLS